MTFKTGSEIELPGVHFRHYVDGVGESHSTRHHPARPVFRENHRAGKIILLLRRDCVVARVQRAASESCTDKIRINEPRLG